MKRLPFKVAPFRDPKRSHLRFVVTGKLNGQRQRKFFTSEGEAKTYAQLKNTQTLQEGAEAAAFSPLLRAMAQKADDLLAPLNVTIQDAAEHYVKHLAQLSSSCSIEQLFTEAIAAKRAAVLSTNYLRRLETVGRRLCARFPNRLVADITTRDINEYLRDIQTWAPSTRNSERIMIQVAFGFAQENGYCLTNVVEKTIIAKTVPPPVGILAVDELTRLLCECPGGILPYVAIGAFAGLRAAELMRLDWRDVHLEDGCIEVTAQNAKSSRRRIVKIHPCLDAWLRPIVKTSGKIAPDESVIHDYRKEACKRAGIKEWPKNALRHSFASYHIAHFKDAASLALEMGHTTTDLIFQHYRQVVRQEAAARYWQIMPLASPATGTVRAYTAEGYSWKLNVFNIEETNFGEYAFTLKELASRLGVSREHIYNWQGHAEAPSNQSDGRRSVAEWRAFTRKFCPRVPLPEEDQCKPRYGKYKFIAATQRTCAMRAAKFFETEAEAILYANEFNRATLEKCVRLEKVVNVVAFEKQKPIGSGEQKEVSA